MSRLEINDLSPAELEEYVSGIGEKPYRAAQIAQWVYKRGVTAFEEMTDLSLSMRETLSSSATLSAIELDGRLVSSDGTEKFLFSLGDGHRVESVLIPDSRRNTLCISTQVGCLMGCTFCLTGTIGKSRDLKPAEIVNQYLAVRDLTSGRVSNIVFMGMGEPLENFEATVTAIEILTHPKFIAFSPKKITVSTSGLVPKIKELGERVSVNLSISLNAPNDEIRTRLMPINRKYPLRELIAASKLYPTPKRKRVTFEYVLLRDVNDSTKEAKELAQLLRGVKCMVNLIPFNEAPGLEYATPEPERVLSFQRILIDSGLHVFIRKSRGRDIMGACGQLAAEYPVNYFNKNKKKAAG